MKIPKSELTKKINKLKSIVPKKTTMPVLQGVLVKDGYFIASNMEVTVKAKIEGIGKETFLIPEKAFDLINNLPDGEVEIKKGRDNTIVIKAQKVRNTYQTMEPELFPAIKELDGCGNAAIESKRFLESVKKVSYAVAKNAANPIMAAMCLQATGEYLNFAGLDGHMLAWDKIEYSGKFELLIPRNAVEKLQALELEGELSIKYNDSEAVFATDNYEVHTRLIEGAYYNYKSMFREMPFHITMARMELLDAMTRVRTCIEEKVPVRFDIKEDNFDITAKDSRADYQETIILQEKISKDLMMGFNVNLLIETLKAFTDETIHIRVADQKNPMIMEAGDGNFKAIVLPVVI